LELLVPLLQKCPKKAFLRAKTPFHENSSSLNATFAKSSLHFNEKCRTFAENFVVMAFSSAITDIRA
jgi:hypothetical protein